MRLTSFTDYCLRVLMYLGTDPDRRATIAEIASAFDISRNHLMKVVHFLGQEGLLTNVRGRSGGIELARAPEAINIGAVVKAAEGDALVAECFDARANTCGIVKACRLRGILREAVEAFQTVLSQYTLADLLVNHKALARVLLIDERRRL
ncbi:MAG: Rrf2 family transcriptional regulator [Proteobacteria bacterium]|nr:Rrf2 family transcriptional regulator [Pseudomonadota bacterium]